ALAQGRAEGCTSEPLRTGPPGGGGAIPARGRRAAHRRASRRPARPRPAALELAELPAVARKVHRVTEPCRVVILGAGPAGLVAAYQLTRLGRGAGTGLGRHPGGGGPRRRFGRAGVEGGDGGPPPPPPPWAAHPPRTSGPL